MHLSNIGKIRNFLIRNSTATLVHALVSSKLDFCNCLLFGWPDYQIHRLQISQNCSARLVTQREKYQHVTPVHVDLHWLPVQARIAYGLLICVPLSSSNSSSVSARPHHPLQRAHPLRSANKPLNC